MIKDELFGRSRYMIKDMSCLGDVDVRCIRCVVLLMSLRMCLAYVKYYSDASGCFWLKPVANLQWTCLYWVLFC